MLSDKSTSSPNWQLWNAVSDGASVKGCSQLCEKQLFQLF
jgi:hypothetical protein